ncbi:MAG: dCTP deaminase [Candidatus Micrarchaeia archaeon]
MVLSDNDILQAVKAGEIAFSPKMKPGQLNGASVDLTLGGVFWKFKEKYVKAGEVDLSKVGFAEATYKVNAPKIRLGPSEMCLGITEEKITLSPGIIGTLEGRSRFARMGLAVHVTSALVQPGSSNHQVLEIVNMAPFPVVIRKGMRISQVVFERLESPTTKPYARFGKIATKQ